MDVTRLPSEKQIKLAESVARKLGLPLPEEFSARAYWEFTNENITRSAGLPNPPSERQIRTANIIAGTLQIPLPAEFTAKAYWDFTHDHIGESAALAKRRARCGA